VVDQVTPARPYFPKVYGLTDLPAARQLALKDSRSRPSSALPKIARSVRPVDGAKAENRLKSDPNVEWSVIAAADDGEAR